ncbi:MAG: carbohydrate ABC transporter permease [Myxococcota bacterium]
MSRAIAVAVAGVGFAALLLPLAAALLGSLLPEESLLVGGLFRRAPLGLDHYRQIFTQRDLWEPLRNSLVIATATTVLCLLVGTLCAYALARLRFSGRSFLLVLVLAASLMPQISLVPPLYLLLRRVGLLHSYPGLVLPYLTFALPLCVWLLVASFRALPPELEEAARLDGAGRLRILLEVVLPLVSPALAAIGIITFVACWNEFLFALSFTLGPERQTLPVAIALFRGQYQVPWGQVLAASVVATLPVAALVLVFQRRIVRGLTSGAIEG